MVGVVTKTLSLQSNLEARSSVQLEISMVLCGNKFARGYPELSICNTSRVSCNPAIRSLVDLTTPLFRIIFTGKEGFSQDLSKTVVKPIFLRAEVIRNIIATKRLKHPHP